MSGATVYEQAGGEPAFRSLVDRFYSAVAADPVLRKVYPEPDLSDARERLTLFLIQYWGGPNTYSRLRGHPRLRLRHKPFAIGQTERDRWLHHMTEAVQAGGFEVSVRDALLEYFDSASTAMINHTSTP